MYDFMVFGYFATAIGNAHFPPGDVFGTWLTGAAAISLAATLLAERAPDIRRSAPISAG